MACSSKQLAGAWHGMSLCCSIFGPGFVTYGPFWLMASSSSSSWHNGPSGQFFKPYVPAAAAATTRAEPGEEPECEDLAALTDHMEPPPLEVEAPRWFFQPASPCFETSAYMHGEPRDFITVYLFGRWQSIFTFHLDDEIIPDLSQAESFEYLEV